MTKNYTKMAIGGVAATIAGAYYLYGSREGQAVRKNVSAFAVKMKGEMLQGLEKLKEVSEPKYKELLKKVGEKYKKSAAAPEVKKVVGEIGAVWNKMKKEVNAEIVRRAEQIKKEEAKTKSKVKGAVSKVKKTMTKAKSTVKKVVAMKKETPATKNVDIKVESEMSAVAPVENNIVK